MFHNLYKSSQRVVTVTCTDNDKSVKASLIRSQTDMIIVELENGLRLTMHKSPTNASLYIGNSGGLEFICKPLSN